MQDSDSDSFYCYESRKEGAPVNRLWALVASGFIFAACSHEEMLVLDTGLSALP